MVLNFKDYEVLNEFIVLKDRMVTRSKTVTISEPYLELPNTLEIETFTDEKERRSFFIGEEFITLIDEDCFKQLVKEYLKELPPE